MSPKGKVRAPEVKVSPEKFTDALVANNLGPVVQVPCSYLKDFLNYLKDTRRIKVEDPVNEAVAMGLANGHYAATGEIPIVAIQNSGLLNTLNSLTSYNQIYKSPVFMMVTWRGEGGKGKDAPEHDITGQNLLKILRTFDLPYEILNGIEYTDQVRRLKKRAEKTSMPVVLVVRKNTFEPYEINNEGERDYRSEMTRLDAIKKMKGLADGKAVFLSGTGFPTRDSFAAGDTPDLYVVGSMGHVFSNGLAAASHSPDKKFVVFDGDGGALMHLGGLASFDSEIKNLIYAVLDNQVYESTGGQPNASRRVDYGKIAKAVGFKSFYSVDNRSDLEKAFMEALRKKESTFLHIRIKTGGETHSARVSDTYSCSEILARFSDSLK